MEEISLGVYTSLSCMHACLTAQLSQECSSLCSGELVTGKVCLQQETPLHGALQTGGGAEVIIRDCSGPEVSQAQLKGQKAPNIFGPNYHRGLLLPCIPLQSL